MGFKPIKITKYTISLPASSSFGTPCRMVLLADLHDEVFGDHNEELLSAIDSVKPDAVLSAGDLIVGRSADPSLGHALELLRTLSAHYPVFCVNGNHETHLESHAMRAGSSIYKKYERALRRMGVYLLRNERVSAQIAGRKFTFYGLELDRKYYGHGRLPQMPMEEVESLLGKRSKEDTYCILLAHNPEHFAAYAEWGADLTLAGHLHGGIIRLPVLGGVISPSLRLFPKYDHGLYERDGKQMIVSAGLSCHTIRIRINNPPELVALEFV